MINIHFQATEQDKPFFPFLKPILGGKANVSLNTDEPSTVTEVMFRARSRGSSKYIATTSSKLLQLLLRQKSEPAIDDYAGSIIKKDDFEFLIVDPCKQLATVSYGRFLYERWFSKFLKPSDWMRIPEFTWTLFDPKQTEYLSDLFSSAVVIAADIETPRDEPLRAINCISFSALHIISETNSFTITTVVIPFTDLYNIAFAKTLLRLSSPKIFQNGKYDIAYLLRYGIAPINWAFDTINMFHCWYSELPKDLGFISSFCLREWEYHKDESSTGNLQEYYRYNAKDTFSTLLVFLSILREWPDYAYGNFLAEFPLVFPCVMAEMRGIKCDVQRMRELGEQTKAVFEGERRKLGTLVACDSFNPGSWQQTQRLFIALGSADIKRTGKIEQDKVSNRHPLNKRILTSIKVYRENRKLYGGYIDEEKLWNGRIFFALNPHATDTSRLASKESQYWCGFQIQNIPRDRKDIQIKSYFVSDPGFLFGEGDYEQNEARGTAYLSGDVNLIATVDDVTKDFHGSNASEFFGVSYDAIINSYQDEIGQWIHDVVDKALRDLSKRTNHGANYNMGPSVMLDTMGIENVIRAKALLKLPSSWSLIKVTEYLLLCYSRRFPVVKSDWYDKVKSDVRSTRMLVGPTGWTRYCFGNPDKNKLHLNSYVAHPPQSLAAQALNKAYLKVFYDVALPNPRDFKLGPQIHDSIVFQYRTGRQDLAFAVKQCMEMDIPITDTFGVKRTLRVPVDMKGGATRWNEVKKLKMAA